MRPLTIIAVALATVATPAAAETYRATAVEIDNAAAVVTVAAEDRADVSVEIVAGARLPAPSVRVSGDAVLIDGGLNGRLRGCTRTAGAERVRVTRIGQVERRDLTHITVRMPRQLAYEAGGAVYSSIGASAGGRVVLNGCGRTEIAASAGDLELTLNGSGDVRAERVSETLTATLNGSGSLDIASAAGDARLRLNGSGDLEIGDVAGALDARIAGSGALRADDARTAVLRLAGSGDLSVGDVAGAVDGQVAGSGSLRAGAAGGDMRLSLAGSGDVDAGAVSGSLTASLHGSGDLRVASVVGESANLSAASSGNLRVGAGRVERLTARSTGSGNVSFGGSAAITRATLTSSGDISISDAGRVEQLTDSGSGSVLLGR